MVIQAHRLQGSLPRCTCMVSEWSPRPSRGGDQHSHVGRRAADPGRYGPALRVHRNPFRLFRSYQTRGSLERVTNPSVPGGPDPRRSPPANTPARWTCTRMSGGSPSGHNEALISTTAQTLGGEGAMTKPVGDPRAGPVRRVDPRDRSLGRYGRVRAGSHQSAGTASIHCAPACLAADPDQNLHGVRGLPEAGMSLSTGRTERSDDHQRPGDDDWVTGFAADTPGFWL